MQILSLLGKFDRVRAILQYSIFNNFLGGETVIYVTLVIKWRDGDENP